MHILSSSVLLLVCTFCTFSGAIYHRLGPKGVKLDNNACGGVTCRSGRECQLTPGGSPACECVRSCTRARHREICGSDGRMYRNYCELRRASCLQGENLRAISKGACPNKPVACLRKERDQLLAQVAVLLPPPGRHLDAAVSRCDVQNIDASLDASELLQCLRNAAFETSTVSGTNENQANKLMEALCVEALIQSGDENNDWRLNSIELGAMLRPGYEPRNTNCSLEGKDYTEGGQTMVDCNICVCACGHWVCSSVLCDHSLDFEDWDLPRKQPHKSHGGKKGHRLKLIKAKEWETE